MNFFGECVAQTQTYLYETWVDMEPKLRNAVRAPKIAAQADAANGCVHAFLLAEMGGEAVGRVGLIKSPPPLGGYARASIASMPPDQLFATERAIGRTIAIGYVVIAANDVFEGEQRALLPHSCEEMWPAWIGTMGRVTKYGFPEDLHRFFCDVGAEAFSAWIDSPLNDRGVNARKLRKIASFYVETGMGLRAVQLIDEPIDKLIRDDPVAQDHAKRWPYKPEREVSSRTPTARSVRAEPFATADAHKPKLHWTLATKEQLSALPGISRDEAERLVETRKQGGGPKRFQDLATFIEAKPHELAVLRDALEFPSPKPRPNRKGRRIVDF